MIPLIVVAVLVAIFLAELFGFCVDGRGRRGRPARADEGCQSQQG